MRGLRHRPRAVPAIRFPPRRRSDAFLWDSARGRCRRWPVQAMDALPVTALGCPIRTGWRSGRSNHRADRALIVNPMVRSCPPNVWRISRAAPIDRDCLHAMIARKISTISLAAQRRRAACAGWAALRRRAALTCQPCWRTRAVPGIASEGVPSWRWWTRRRSDALPRDGARGRSRDSVPTSTAAAGVPRDGVRRRSRC
jgi:hypothetical protein